MLSMLRFGVIGYPVMHSLSPQVHGAAFQALGIDAISEKIEVKPKDLAEFMKDFREKFSGVNVTIPHKEAIMAFLDEIDGEAQAIGAVNAIVNKNGTLIGYNTDSYGAMMALYEKLEKDSPPFEAFLLRKKVTVLGAGGASRAVCFGVLKHGAESLMILNRHAERAKEIADDLGSLFFGHEIKVGNFSDFDPENIDMLINTTSCGMIPYENETPLNVTMSASKGDAKKLLVMDIVYRPRMTRFLREAKEAGCEIITGERMFLHQAAKGFELWTGQKAPLKEMEEVLYKTLD